MKNKVLTNKHGVQIVITEQMDKPFYFLTYNAGEDMLFQAFVFEEQLGGVDLEYITPDMVVELSNS